MAGKKISELTALGAAFATTDLFEISDDGGGGLYTSKSITGGNMAVGVVDAYDKYEFTTNIFLSNAKAIGRDNGTTRNANLQFVDVAPSGNVGFSFRDGGSDKVFIDGSGKIGVGTTDPKTSLSTIYDYDTIPFETQLADNEGGGEILKYGSAQAGAIGTLHFLHTDGSWDQADANAVATGGSQLLGIPMGTDPGTDGMLIKGFYKVASGNIDGTPAIGAPVYIADDATGEFDFTAPAGSGDIVRIVGYCIDIDGSDILLHFNPDKTWVELA
jgi:hypothetical protein